MPSDMRSGSTGEPTELRYRDCPTTEVDAFIDAAPETVWPIVTDIELPARFSSELQAAGWLDGAIAPRIGARFFGRSQHDAIGTWETVCTITELDAPRVFGYVVGEVDEPSSAWRFTLQPEGTGTRLMQWMRIGPARSFVNVAIDSMPDKESRILHRRLAEHRANMQATLEGIRAIAES